MKKNKVVDHITIAKLRTESIPKKVITVQLGISRQSVYRYYTIVKWKIMLKGNISEMVKRIFWIFVGVLVVYLWKKIL